MTTAATLGHQHSKAAGPLSVNLLAADMVLRYFVMSRIKTLDVYVLFVRVKPQYFDASLNLQISETIFLRIQFAESTQWKCLCNCIIYLAVISVVML